MQIRPMTEEEYAIAGVALDVCTNCKCQSLRKPYKWVYYRDNGTPKVLCESCFDRKCEHGPLADAALLASPQAAACDEPQRAFEISGLPQVVPELVNVAFDSFRDLSPAEIKGFIREIPIHAKPGHQLEWFGPVRWWSILTCLAWLREIDRLLLGHLFGRWAKLEAVLADTLPGVDHKPWRERIAAMAQSEFLFRYSVLLSDAVSAAHAKAAKKKTGDQKRKVFAAIKAATCEHEPPATLDGAAQELQRFIDYMDAQVAEISQSNG